MIKLIRNFETKKEKEQELHLLETNNIDLFFSIEQKIEEIDQWSIKAVRKLMNNISHHNDMIFYYKKWNKTIDEISKSPNIEIIDYDFVFNDDFITLLKTSDVFKLRKTIDEMSDQEICSAILSIFTIIRHKENLFKQINNAINTNITTSKKLLNLFVFKYIMEKVS